MTYSVLLLDDDKEFNKLVTTVLKAKNIQVVETTSGAEAKSKLDTEHFDLAIVDGILPDTDGIDWIEQVKDSGNDMQMIYVSSSWRDSASYHRLIHGLEVSLVIHKPIVPYIFAEQIADQLKVQKQKKLSSKDKDIAAQKKVETIAALANLKNHYTQELPERINELKDCFEQAKQKQNERVLLNQARTFAHKLSGTAGSHGFHKLGTLMAQIERHIVMFLNGNLPPLDFWKQIDKTFTEAVNYVENIESKNLQEPENVSNPELNSACTQTLPKILVIDDDPNFLGIIEVLGKQSSIETIGASTANQALEEANKTIFDAIIIDVQLGENDISFELAKKLREIPGNETLPLAFVSARAHVLNRVAAANAGASLFLSKPLSLEAFQSAVHYLVGLKQPSPANILLVDDDEGFCRRASMIFRDEGMKVSTLSNPLHILEQLDKSQPDLLILDVLMPGLSGFDISRMLRTNSLWQDLPIILLTAQGWLGSGSEKFEAGADDYLSKTVSDEELISKVKLRVDRHRSLKDKATKDALIKLLQQNPFQEDLSK